MLIRSKMNTDVSQSVLFATSTDTQNIFNFKMAFSNKIFLFWMNFY